MSRRSQPEQALILLLVIAIGVFQTSFALAQNPAPATQTGATAQTSATAILAGGCFWCVESDFEKLTGVTDVESGYSGGTTQDPTYKNYASGGHREVVKITYDPSKVTYAGLVEWLIKHIDPTDAGGSFNDRGKEYAPAVYYETDVEKAAAERVIAAVNQMNIYKKPLALDIMPQEKFWLAEDYHQDYHSQSLVKYDYYRYKSGRDAFIKKHWGERAKKLELAGSTPATSTDSPTDVKNTSETNAAVETIAAKPWENFQKPSQQQLKQTLTNVQFDVTQKEGTERPFNNDYWDKKSTGIYVDVVSGEPLFSSADKYKSGTGWPSFVKPIDLKFITLKSDNTLFTTRTEVRSKAGDSHLGHVFEDGPAARGGKRYCMNSAAMKFIPKEKMEEMGYADYLPLFGE